MYELVGGLRQRCVELFLALRGAAALRKVGPTPALAAEQRQRLLEERSHRGALGAFRTGEDQVAAAVLERTEQGSTAGLRDRLRDGAGERGAAGKLLDHRAAGREQPLCLQRRELFLERIRDLAPRLRLCGDARGRLRYV